MNRILLAILIIVLVAGAVYIFVNPNGNSNETANQSTSINMNTNDSNSNAAVETSDIVIIPISHASMVLKAGDKVIYTDPVGGAVAFSGQADPNIILLTDIHADHFDLNTLKVITKPVTTIILPQAVADLIKEDLPGTMKIMQNGGTITEQGIKIEAIPMYNLPETATAYHVKGRGNGYVIEASGERIYVSGDTADIPEMRALKNIDKAFVSMNLPYTMSVESAAAGVLAFKPKKVYPYHYRGSEVNKFKELVNTGDKNIEVVLLDWYNE